MLLPVRDGAATLADCLDSLAVQTLADHEVVVVDDGSSDATAALLAARVRTDGRLRVTRTPARGLVAALNAGLALARAPLLARMDADDVCAPERLALQAQRLRRDPAVDVLGCRVELVGAPGSDNQGMHSYVAWQNRLLDHDTIVRDLFVESPLTHPSVMLRTRTLRRLGGYRQFDGPEDYDLWLRAHAAGLRFGKLPQTLLRWRDGASRLTRCDARYAAERFRALKIAALEAGTLRGRPVVVWGAGPIGKGWARALGARGHLVAAFVEVAAGRIGQRIHGAPVVSLSGVDQLRGALHLAAVGQPGARERIRREARRHGLRDGVDLLAVA